MNTHFRKDMDRLKARLIELAMAVEENTRRSVKALRDLSPKLAREVVELDMKIDMLEVDVEEECLKILALHQPVAGDLRFVVTVLKINNELEHIGDTACNIAKRVEFMASDPVRVIPPLDIETMSSRMLWMLKNALDAFLSGDESLAYGVCEDDEIVDAENRMTYSRVEKGIKNDPSSAMAQLNYLTVSRMFERAADLCTNIAEDVIYMKSGEIVRHNMREAVRKYREGRGG